MKIPKKIKVGAIEFAIVMENFEDCGKLIRAQDKIIISKDLSQGNREITLLHEILHQINCEVAEVIVDGLAFGLHQVLEENDLYGGK